MKLVHFSYKTIFCLYELYVNIVSTDQPINNELHDMQQICLLIISQTT